MIRQGEPDMPLSHLFLYYQERVLENTIGSDAGAEIRDGMKVVAGQGVPPETAWPYDPLRFAETPPPAAYAAATAHEALEYRSVPLDLVQLQGCMAEGYPVVLGISVFESFMSDAVAHSNGLIPLPATSEQNLGGHAVALCGYDNSIQRFILRNSWSTSWADRGYGYIPFAYILDANLTADAWTIRRTT
jgi:C1A family cysteine protease